MVFLETPFSANPSITGYYRIASCFRGRTPSTMRSAQSMPCFLRRVTSELPQWQGLGTKRSLSDPAVVGQETTRLNRPVVHAHRHPWWGASMACHGSCGRKQRVIYIYIYTCTYYMIYIYILYNVIHMICV